MKTTFFRLLEASDKAGALKQAILHPDAAQDRVRFKLDAADFGAVPSSPFSYWVSDRLRNVFGRLPRFESEGRTAKCGAGTLDDFRFLRLSWETESESTRWVPFAKGGSFGRFYSDIYLTIAWKDDGAELQCFVAAKVGSATRKIQAQGWYFRPGLTWPRRTNGLSMRVLPAGCIFADKGPSAFVEGNDSRDLLALASITNSRVFFLLVALQLARTELAQSFEVGLIQNTPVPNLGEADRNELAALAQRSWSLGWMLDSHIETSHAFTLPALLQVEGESLAARSKRWSARIEEIALEKAAIQKDIDGLCFTSYGVVEADAYAAMERTVAEAGDITNGEVSTDEEDEETDGSVELLSSASGAIDSSRRILATEMLSWAVGVVFGRFDVRLSIGERPTPVAPDPFSKMPTSSPGMLAAAEDASPSFGYPVPVPADGLLVHDEGHSRDMTAQVRSVFAVVFGSHAEDWWVDIEACLEMKGPGLRAWFATTFFDYHLKGYSKSRRKAPIYWQLSTASGSYSVWLYTHRLSKDTLLQIQNDVVGPKLVDEELNLASLKQEVGGNIDTKQLRAIETTRNLVEELRALLDEVKRVAPLWRPSLDDGVAITMAPLWRLVPHHRAWQKELRAKWDDLVAGKYDWSQVAMHLWPERVVPKCAADRSLAIAHGLQENFWFEDDDGKWESYEKPKRSMDALVRERTSSAVKAALKSLLEAPDATGGVKRTRRSKAA
jgi:hypothetical protein